MRQRKGLILALITGLVVASLVLAAGCYPATEESEGGFDWTIIVFLVLIFAAFYFLMVRPQRKRQKEQRELMEGLQRGDKVVTVGGIYGQIESSDEETVVIKVESGATIRMSRAGIAGKRER